MRVRLGAHPVTVSRLYATSRVSGVLGIVYCLTGGAYLTLGGAYKLQSNVWRPLKTTVSAVIPTGWEHVAVGAVLLTAGVLGMLGLALNRRRVSLASAALATLWSAYVTVLFAGLDVMPPPDDDNFIAFSQAFITAVFVLRFLLLVVEPDHDDEARLR